MFFKIYSILNYTNKLIDSEMVIINETSIYPNIVNEI